MASKVLDGVFAINKPMGLSSAQVIRDAQIQFNPSGLFAPLLAQEQANRDRESNSQRRRRGHAKRDLRVKMGHGGTLDPLATGVLILGVGKGTKALPAFLGCTKTYEAVVLFGASTDTYDRVGRIIKKGRYGDVTRAAFEDALAGFRGRYQQMPPLYSALKMEGKPLYEYAREGKPIPREIATREVEVTELEMVEWFEPGTHSYRWPAEEAQEAEKNVVNSVWQVARRQAAAGPGELVPLTPEQEQQEEKAAAEFEHTKRKANERVDDLVYDSGDSQRSPKRQKKSGGGGGLLSNSSRDRDPKADFLMSGALGDLPPSVSKGKGSNLIPPPPAPGTPPPWEGKGPPAAKIRMTVTSGFYVRSLCHDIGEKLGCGAMMAELCRSRQGDFQLGTPNCIEYDDLAKGEAVWGPRVKRALLDWSKEPDSGSGSDYDDPVKDVKDAYRAESSQKVSRKARSPPTSSPLRNEIRTDEDDAAMAAQPAESQATTEGTATAVASQADAGALPTPMKSQETLVEPDESKRGEEPADPAQEDAEPADGKAEDEWTGFEDGPTQIDKETEMEVDKEEKKAPGS